MHSVNLLPLRASQQFRRKRIIQIWCRAIVVAIGLSTGLIFLGQSTAGRERQQTERLLAVARAPREMQQEYQQLQQRLRQLETYEKKQRDLRSEYSPLIVMQMLHQHKQELDGQLVVHSLDYVDESFKSGKASDKPRAAGTVTMQLATDGTLNSSKAMQLIRQSGYFHDVKLSSALEKTHSQGANLKFSIRCEF